MTDLRDLILDTYETVADSSRWSCVLDQVSNRVGARGCLIFELEGAGPARQMSVPYASASYDPALITHYLDTHFNVELADQECFEAHSLASDGITLIDDSVLAPSRRALRQRDNVRHLMRYGIWHRAAGLLNKDNKLTGRFSAQMGREHGPLNAEEQQSLAVLMPHMAKALELGRLAAQLAAMNSQLIAAINRLRIGVCILDGHNHVVVSNQEFGRQFERYPAFSIAPGGKLKVEGGPDQHRLAQLLGDAMNHGQHGARPRKEAVLLPSNQTTNALCMELAPLNRVDEMGTHQFGGSILYSLDNSLPVHTDADLVKRLFDLSEAETALTTLLSEGLTNGQIAERRERSVETVNAQVKAILSKTQCANRTQLARLFSTLSTNYLLPVD